MIAYEIEQLVPPTEAATVAEAKRAARVLHDDEDDLFEHLIAAATALVDGPFGYLGQCVVSQQWRVSYPQGTVSGTTPLELPFGPVTAIGSIKTYDGTTLSADLKANFDLFKGRFKSTVQPKDGESWPALADRPDALQIEFAAGDATAKVTTKQAILMMVAHWYANREHSPMDADFQALGVAGLLQNERRLF